MSRCSPLSNQVLAGIIKRQPASLDLSWTPLAKRQLNCLLTRLPGTHTRTHFHTRIPLILHFSYHPPSVFRSEGAEGDGAVLVLPVGAGLPHAALPAAAGPALV